MSCTVTRVRRGRINGSVSRHEQQVRWRAEHLPRQTHVRPEPWKGDDAVLSARPAALRRWPRCGRRAVRGGTGGPYGGRAAGEQGHGSGGRVGLCSGWRAAQRTTRIDADHSCGCVGAYHVRPVSPLRDYDFDQWDGGEDEDEDQHQYPSQASTFRSSRVTSFRGCG